MVGIYEFMPSSWLVHQMAEKVCDRDKYGEALCENMLFSIGGYDLQVSRIFVMVDGGGMTPSTRLFFNGWLLTAKRRKIILSCCMIR